MILNSNGLTTLDSKFGGTCITIVSISGIFGSAVLTFGYLDDFKNFIPYIDGDIAGTDTQYRIENGLGVVPVLEIAGADGTTNISVLVSASDT